MDIFVGIWTAITTVFFPKLLVLFAVALVDFVLGVLLAIAQKRFEWERLTDYISNSLLPILGWFVYAVITTIPVEFIPEGAFSVSEWMVYSTVFLKIFASVLGHLSAIGLLEGTMTKIGVFPTGKTQIKG